MKKSWHIDRRTALKTAGVSLALPWLEGMSFGAESALKADELPRRMCCVLFPYGIAVPKDDDPAREWGWFPTGDGRDYTLTNPLQPLQSLMDDVTIFSGLSHPNCRRMNGHDTGDTFLTGNNLEAVTYRNTISVDQFAAQHIGRQTRIPSLTISTDGGIGPRTRSTTLSYSPKGQPIPSLADPQQIFNRMFGQDQASETDRRRLETSGSILDLVRDQSKSLRRNLGVADQRKLDEYETSVRDVEQRIAQSREWLKVPLPEVDASSIKLDADPDSAGDYIGAMYDLMFLAFQTDLTRLTTYQIGSYGPTLARTFPAAIGLEPNWHSLAHGAGKKGGAEKLGKFDQYLAEHLARFCSGSLTRRKVTAAVTSHCSLRCTAANSRTHVNSNYPLLLAGGQRLGLKHNQYLGFGDKTPMSNLFVTMLQALNIEVDRFADSTGTCRAFLAPGCRLRSMPRFVQMSSWQNNSDRIIQHDVIRLVVLISLFCTEWFCLTFPLPQSQPSDVLMSIRSSNS